MDVQSYFSTPTELQGLLRLVNLLIAAKSPMSNSLIPAVDPAFFGGPMTVTVVAATSTLPQSAIISAFGVTMFLLTGLDAGMGHVLNLESGWVLGKDPTDSWDCNSGLYAAAKQMIGLVPLSSPMTDNNVVVVGHSYGGAVGQIIAAILNTSGIPKNVSCFSFGSPRPGGSILSRNLANMRNTRIFTFQDPVPHIPPHTDECPSLVFIEPPTVWRNMNEQVQPPIGYVLSTIGTLNPATNNPPLSGFTLSLLTYITDSITGEGSGYHSLPFYGGLLQMGIASQGPLVTIRPRQLPEPPFQPTARDRNIIREMAESQIRADATSPTGITRNYVVPTVSSPAAPRYRAARDGRAWVIKLGEEIVAVGTGKRQAKKIARSFNKTARVLL